MSKLNQLGIKTRFLCIVAAPVIALMYFAVESQPIIAGVSILFAIVMASILLRSTPKESSEHSRLESAVDTLKTHVMVADADLNILYMNSSLKEMFENAEADIKKDLPHFNSETLVGTNIDVFHKNPAHQRGLLAKLTSTFESQLEIGGRSFRIIANPILDTDNTLTGIAVEWADRTAELVAEREINTLTGQVDALARSQAVIRFNMDGTIITANDNFLSTVGYSLNEIEGKHHSIFTTSEYKASKEYQEFWAALNRGEDHAGEFERVGKNGNKIWLQASYNPILDLDGKPFMVVKYAIDTTKQKELQTSVENILQEVSDVMLSLADGETDKRVNGEYQGQFAQLKKTTNDYCKKLIEMVEDIRQVSDLVKTGAGEISNGNMDLSRRTETQAAALEETSASMEEITSTVKQNADNANEANQLAKEASNQAQVGGEVVDKAVNAMNEINEASNKISNIISVIDEIAFQTNLLALNAAVEAARAGEQGRGFAVVATEVRNLAGRSASAAKEIKELIEDSVSKVEEGSRLVNQSGETLEEIMGSIKKVAEIVGDITSASQEQAQGIEQVNTAIVELDTTTQQNTALVEESAAAAESMSEQSNELGELISFFKVDDSEDSPLAQRSTEERRSAGRPWSNDRPARADAKKESSGNSSQKVSGSDIDSDDWEEF
ncbi:MAG: methyl-accepting chemotaxis protein [Gammaproteobacteria bacterium]